MRKDLQSKISIWSYSFRIKLLLLITHTPSLIDIRAPKHSLKVIRDTLFYFKNTQEQRYAITYQKQRRIKNYTLFHLFILLSRLLPRRIPAINIQQRACDKARFLTRQIYRAVRNILRLPHPSYRRVFCHVFAIRIKIPPAALCCILQKRRYDGSG